MFVGCADASIKERNLSSSQPGEVGTMYNPTLEKVNLRLGEVEWFGQNHKSRRWQSGR